MIATPLARPLARALARPLAMSGDYDPDAADYFARAGVTDPQARRELNGAIKGLKSRGRWSQLREMWVLRSSHNRGSGTTAYGLKGNHDGTLVNGPTWAANGILFTFPSNSVITTDLPTSLPVTRICVSAPAGFYDGSVSAVAGSGNGQLAVGVEANYVAQNRWWGWTPSVGGSVFAQADTFVPNNYVFFGCSGTGNWNSFLLNKDGDSWKGADSGTSTPGVGGNLQIGYSGNSGEYFAGTITLVAEFNVALTSSEQDEIRELLIATVCRGLDLEFDQDARDYFRRAGVTDYSAKQDINDLIVGLKSLNACTGFNGGVYTQPYNKGTGTVATSLKSGNDGSLDNGPAWDAKGIKKDVVGAHIRFANPFNGTPTPAYTLLWFGEITSTAARLAQFFSTGNVDSQQRLVGGAHFGNQNLYSAISTQDTIQQQVLSQTPAQLAALRFFVSTYSSNQLRTRFLRNGDTSLQTDGPLAVTGTFTPSTDVLWVGDNATYTGQDFQGITYGAFWVPAAVDAAAVYNLAKATVFKNLSLPTI